MKLSKSIEAVGCRELLKDFYASARQPWGGEILKFGGMDGLDVYNPSVPFEIDGETVIAGRVEVRSSEASQTMFFVEKNGEWVPKAGAPVLENLQDPFVTKIAGEAVVGGVYAAWSGHDLLYYHTDFHRGATLRGLKHFLSGPDAMKDIRLCELPDGRVAVFSRPQGQKMLDRFGCIAKIGFTICDSLEAVTAEVIENAPFLEGVFLPTEWGGCNQLHILKNGLIGVIGHKSYMNEDNIRIHYHCMAFVVDPKTGEFSQNKIICTRSCFPEGPAKNARAADVTFASGIVRNDDGTATIYSGLSDCQIGRATIVDPFLEYEN